MGSIEFGVVLFGETGQPESDGFESGTAHFLAAIIQPLQQLCGEKKHKDTDTALALT